MEYTAFKDQVSRHAADAALDAFELYSTDGTSIQISVTKGEIDRYQDATSGGAGLKVLRDGKAGFAYTEVYDDESAARLVIEAVENLSVIDAESADRIYDTKDEFPDVPQYDGAFESVQPEDAIQWALDMEQAALNRDQRIAMVPSSTVAIFRGRSRMANSAGLDLSFSNGGAYAYTQALATVDSDRKTGLHFGTALAPDGMDVLAIGQRAADKAVEMLGASSIESGTYPVVIHHDQFGSLLQIIMSMVSAENVQRGLSAFADKLGSTVGSTLVTVVDVPMVEGSLFNAPFDSQGVAARRTPIFSAGVLESYLHSLKTAAKDGVAPTGNGFRGGYRGGESIHPVNVVVETGEVDYDGLLATLDRGLVINSLSGLHSGANQASGQFSLSATGLLVEKGRVTRPVDQITISGTFSDLLARIEAVGSDRSQAPVFSYGMYTPSVLVGEIDVAG